MRAHVATDADLDKWQDFVDRSAGAGCMHHAGWFQVLRDVYRVTPYFLMAIDEGGSLQGILPAYFSRSPLTGHHISSLEDGVLATRAEATAALLTEARALRDRTRSRYLQLRGGAIDRPGDVVQPAVHTVIRTSVPVEQLWAAINKKTRWGIRQAQGQDLHIEHDAALASLGEFYTVYAAHMRSLGTPVFGANVLPAIANRLGRGRLRLYTVGYGGRLIGGMLCILNGRRWTDYYAVVRRSPQTEFANYLLYWHVIRDAAQSGADSLDLGRSTPDSNVHLFKNKWRGVDVSVPYHFYLRPGVRGHNVGLGRQKQNKGILQRLWTILPVAVCNRLGPLIRRQLPFI
jgi:hypothetical protein